MSILNHSDLNSDITANIFNNGTQAITGLILQQRLLNLADSSVNKLGDLTIQGLLRYSILPTFSNDGDIINKKYVDDSVSTLVVTASNGLTKTLGDIKLGGILSQNTDIDIDSFFYNIGDGNIFNYIDSSFVGFGDGTGNEISAQGALGLRILSGNEIRVTSTNGDINLTSDAGLINLSSDDATTIFSDTSIDITSSGPIGVLSDVGLILSSQNNNVDLIKDSSHYIRIGNFGGSIYARLDISSLISTETYQFPPQSGTLALTSDISGLLSNTLNSSKIFVGNGSNIATGVDLTLSASGGAFSLSNAGILTMPNADTSTRGLLTSTDWNTFNNKVSTSRILNINGNSYDLSANREWRTAQADTGCLTYASPGIAVASGTQVNISAVTGYIIDNETTPGVPVYTYVNYAGETNKTVTTVGSGIATYVLLNSSGTIVFQNTFPTSAQRKSMIYLAKIGHPTGTITTAGTEPDFITSPSAQFRDVFQGFNYINLGVRASANGANLNINTSAGTIIGNGINFVTDKTNPNNLAVTGTTATTFFRRTQTGAGGASVSLIDPANYDVSGTITAVPGGSMVATIQYIWYVPPLGFIVTYGQNVYSTLTLALQSVGKESNYVVYPSLVKNAISIGALALRKGTTALNSTDAVFVPADIFGQLVGSAGAASVSTMQNTYNNAGTATPKILTSTTNGLIDLQCGSAADTDSVLGIKNIAGTITANILGNGTLNITGALTSGSTTFNLLNVTPTTINFAGNASTALNIGHASGTNTILGNMQVTNIKLLDTTYKTALDVSVANTLRLGNGFTSLITPATLTVASDTDVTTILGRAKISSPSSDIAYYSHFDFATTTGYGLAQDNVGATSLNAPTGQTVTIKNNASAIYQFSATGLTLLGTSFLQLQSTSDSGSIATGCAVFGGGIGIGKKLFLGGDFNLTDAKNIILGTTTGTKIGTATSQKIGLWNATPVVQPTTAITGSAITANSGTAVNDASTFSGYTIGQVVAALRQIGVLA